MQQYTTYILFSKSLDAYYIGFTGDVVNTRLSKHLKDHKGFTSKTKDWEIVYTETYKTKSEAMRREKQLKAWKSKIRIKELISRQHSE